MSFHLTGLALVELRRTGAQWLYALLLLQTPTSVPVWALEMTSSRLRQNAAVARGSIGSAAGWPTQETETVKRENLKHEAMPIHAPG